MIDTLEKLLGLNYTPAAAIAIVAVMALSGVVAFLHRRQNKTREEWHASTLKRVSAVEEESKLCYEDRNKLAVQVGILTERSERMAKCPRANCPLRLP